MESGTAKLLEYAAEPLVGNVVRHQEGNVLTLTIRRSDSLLVRAAIFAAGGLALAAPLIFSLIWMHELLGVMMAMLLASGMGLIGSAIMMAWVALHPTVIVVDAERITLTQRGILQILRQDWPRFMVADVRVERLAFKDTLIRPYVVRLIPYRGEELDLYAGPKEEVRCIEGCLRNALKLPKGNVPEGVLPALRRRSRLRRKVEPLALTLSYAPRRINFSLFLATPVLAIGAVLAACAVNGHIADFFAPGHLSLWVLTIAAVYFVLGTIALQAVVYSLSSRWSLTLDAERLELREVGLRPGHEEWPTEEIEGFDCATLGRRARLELLLTGGRRDILLERLRAFEAMEAQEHLRWALRECCGRNTR